jgi:hypothetical protein
MKKHYRLPLIIIVVLIFSCGCSFAKNKYSYVEINGEKITVEIAETENEKIAGLSKKNKLGDNQGMLFSIDIIWIKDEKVVGIEKNILPEFENKPTIYKSPIPINYVLEVNAGFCDKKNIKEGDHLNFNR